MNFKEKMKWRLITKIVFIVLGAGMIAVNLFVPKAETLSSFGLVLIVLGVVGIRNYAMITKNEETMRRREIEETDERNLMIAAKAKSWALMLWIWGAAIASVVCNAIGRNETGRLLALSVCIPLFLYVILYQIIKKRSQ